MSTKKSFMPSTSPKSILVASTDQDFIPLPRGTLFYRGLKLSRSLLYRLREAGDIKVKQFRVTGGLQGRTFILRESLDAWIERQLAEEEAAA